MNKLVCGRQPNCLPERLNVKFSYYLYGMQPTDISSFNNGPVETNNQKKKINVAEFILEYLKQRQKIDILKQIKTAFTANATSQ